MPLSPDTEIARLLAEQFEEGRQFGRAEVQQEESRGIGALAILNAYADAMAQVAGRLSRASPGAASSLNEAVRVLRLAAADEEARIAVREVEATTPSSKPPPKGQRVKRTKPKADDADGS